MKLRIPVPELLQQRVSRIIIVIAMGVFVVVRGVVPALTHLDTDFPNYYVASRLALEHADLSKIYDHDWYGAQAVAMGLAWMSGFSPFPPATIFVMLPIAWLAPMTALQVWTVANLGVLAVIIYFLTKITGCNMIWCTTIALATGHALVNNFRFGQFYLVLSLFCILIYRGMQTNRHIAAGISLGIGAAIKYFPAIYFFPLAVHRQWKTIAWGIGSALVLMGAGWAMVGTEANSAWMFGWLFHHVDGAIPGQLANSVRHQSWNSWLRQLFVRDAATNPTPMIDWPAAYTIGLTIIYAVMFTLIMIAWRRMNKWNEDDARPFQWALISFGVFTLFPISASYHLVLLILPVALMLKSDGPWSVQQKIIAAAFVVIGFFPYSVSLAFEGRGVLSVLAFPRLYLEVVMFGAVWWRIAAAPGRTAMINQPG